MYFYFIVALQAFCIYHLVKNRRAYYWVFLIIFLPLIGCAIYLITQVYNKKDAEKVSEEIVTILNPTKKIKDLEKKLEFVETFQNHVNLADAYYEIGDYKNAIKQYEAVLDKDHQHDFYVISSLIKSYSKTEDFNVVVRYAKQIENQPEFKKSKIQFLYGLALEKIGQDQEAEAQLKAIDVRYSNYQERLVLAKFLKAKNKTEQAKDILNEIFAESKNMTKTNKNKYSATIAEVEKLIHTY
ncbi:DUF4071 domain-containing protein [Lacinutrix sp. C3R15]|uniref:TRAFs-binding domain-containing protein n=1 Tax=Flavobacteriaceae TaxID=49546 RepID=UPI001C09A4D1|nr:MULTISPECIES: TRAFs-binding domain-containing protein [Flavobacteriaceae]MBU2941019.1 DUF4071 domain-containing protein [Lacinutrix sp. C3R15]MDO6624338.1 TRAFs-binding domain-containing protein [Oceanihabitans sp. 1_MG-2023]